jgi:hypothetical protein
MTLLQSLQSHEWMGLRFHNLSHEPYRMNPSSGKGFALRASTLISLPIFIVEAIASIAFATIASAHLLCSGFKNSSAKAWVIASYNHFLFQH